VRRVASARPHHRTDPTKRRPLASRGKQERKTARTVPYVQHTYVQVVTHIDRGPLGHFTGTLSSCEHACLMYTCRARLCDSTCCYMHAQACPSLRLARTPERWAPFIIHCSTYRRYWYRYRTDICEESVASAGRRPHHKRSHKNAPLLSS